MENNEKLYYLPWMTESEKYKVYLKTTKSKHPRNFGKWLILYAQWTFHRKRIRPQIIWWERYCKENNLIHPKWR